jgi:hypothetical protein
MSQFVVAEDQHHDRKAKLQSGQQFQPGQSTEYGCRVTCLVRMTFPIPRTNLEVQRPPARLRLYFGLGLC